MGLTMSSDEQLLDILTIPSNKITINNNTHILVNGIQFKFYPDIKDKCLKILTNTQENNYAVKFFYYETIIYGLHINYNFIREIHMSKALSDSYISGNNQYYINKKLK